MTQVPPLDFLHFEWVLVIGVSVLLSHVSFLTMVISHKEYVLKKKCSSVPLNGFAWDVTCHISRLKKRVFGIVLCK